MAGFVTGQGGGGCNYSLQKVGSIHAVNSISNEENRGMIRVNMPKNLSEYAIIFGAIKATGAPKEGWYRVACAVMRYGDGNWILIDTDHSQTYPSEIRSLSETDRTAEIKLNQQFYYTSSYCTGVVYAIEK